MIDPDAANVMFAWVEAAARGDLDAVIALSAQDVLDTFAETGDLDDPLVREAVAIGLGRRFGPIQAGELSLSSAATDSWASISSAWSSSPTRT